MNENSGTAPLLDTQGMGGCVTHGESVQAGDSQRDRRPSAPPKKRFVDNKNTSKVVRCVNDAYGEITHQEYREMLFLCTVQ